MRALMKWKRIRLSTVCRAWAPPMLPVMVVLTVTSATPRQSVAGTLSGVITFDRVAETQDNGLDYNNITQKPIRHAVVELLNSQGSKLKQVISGDDGSYSFDFGDKKSVQLRVIAQTDSPKVVVEDNTNQGAKYSVVSSGIDTSGGDVTFNLNAPSGWDGTQYSTTRAAAPFACLDTIYTAARAFVDVRPSANFPALTVYRSVNNRPESGDVTIGQIGTSHYTSSETAMYILGAANIDTDEYDQHVMAHEWGHYFENKLGRSDSIGGTHSFGDIIDPRVAFGEGWGNAVSGMVLYPDPVYKDSSGQSQSQTFSFDVSAELPSIDTTPGWFSEASDMATLYNVFGQGESAKYSVNLGLGAVYDVMTGGEKKTDALTTIFSFTDALKQYLTDQNAAPSQIQAVDNLTTYEKIGAVQDQFGTGETNNGGSSINLPVYKLATIGGGNVTLTFDASVDLFNRLRANKYLRFTADNDADLQISGSSKDVTMTLYESGKVIGYADGQTSGGDDSNSSGETIQLTASKGKTYILAIQGQKTGGSGTYKTTIHVD